MPKAALNIQNQSDRSASHRPETRKLDLVKCDRCRLDKKKVKVPLSLVVHSKADFW
jgi:hypothetical protein